MQDPIPAATPEEFYFKKSGLQCLKGMIYQCRKCQYRGCKIQGIECSAARNSLLFQRYWVRLRKSIYHSWTNDSVCPYFNPKSKRTCGDCKLKFECLTYENLSNKS